MSALVADVAASMVAWSACSLGYRCCVDPRGGCDGRTLCIDQRSKFLDLLLQLFNGIRFRGCRRAGWFSLMSCCNWSRNASISFFWDATDAP